MKRKIKLEDDKLSKLNKVLLQKRNLKPKEINSTPKIYNQKTLDFFGIKTPEANNESNFPPLPPDAKIQIFHWNVNGIRAIINKGFFKDFIEKAKPDILCLNETKIEQIALRQEKIEYMFNKEYLTYWNFAKNKKGYSGVAIFSKYKPLSVMRDINIKEHDQEGRLLYLEYENFIILSVYVPNCGKDRFEYRTKKWDPLFKNFLINLKNSKKKKLILTGDMNVCYQPLDIIDYENYGNIPPFSNEERENFGLILKDVKLIDTFRYLHKGKQQYTWFANEKDRLYCKGMRIDYFLVSDEMINQIEKAEIHKEYFGSDHVPISISLNLSIK